MWFNTYVVKSSIEIQITREIQNIDIINISHSIDKLITIKIGMSNIIE